MPDIIEYCRVLLDAKSDLIDLISRILTHSKPSPNTNQSLTASTTSSRSSEESSSSSPGWLSLFFKIARTEQAEEKAAKSSGRIMGWMDGGRAGRSAAMAGDGMAEQQWLRYRESWLVRGGVNRSETVF